MSICLQRRHLGSGIAKLYAVAIGVVEEELLDIRSWDLVNAVGDSSLLQELCGCIDVIDSEAQVIRAPDSGLRACLWSARLLLLDNVHHHSVSEGFAAGKQQPRASKAKVRPRKLLESHHLLVKAPAAGREVWWRGDATILMTRAEGEESCDGG